MIYHLHQSAISLFCVAAAAPARCRISCRTHLCYVLSIKKSCTHTEIYFVASSREHGRLFRRCPHHDISSLLFWHTIFFQSGADIEIKENRNRTKMWIYTSLRWQVCGYGYVTSFTPDLCVLSRRRDANTTRRGNMREIAADRIFKRTRKGTRDVIRGYRIQRKRRDRIMNRAQMTR